jgi:hypothetical protein
MNNIAIMKQQAISDLRCAIRHCNNEAHELTQSLQRHRLYLANIKKFGLTKEIDHLLSIHNAKPNIYLEHDLDPTIHSYIYTESLIDQMQQLGAAGFRKLVDGLKWIIDKLLGVLAFFRKEAKSNKDTHAKVQNHILKKGDKIPAEQFNVIVDNFYHRDDWNEILTVIDLWIVWIKQNIPFIPPSLAKDEATKKYSTRMLSTLGWDIDHKLNKLIINVKPSVAPSNDSLENFGWDIAHLLKASNRLVKTYDSLNDIDAAVATQKASLEKQLRTADPKNQALINKLTLLQLNMTIKSQVVLALRTTLDAFNTRFIEVCKGLRVSGQIRID